jgi:hypothetical protein
MLLHMVFSTRCCGRSPEEQCVVLCAVCKFVSGYKLTHSTQYYTPLLRTKATTPSAEPPMQ